MLRHLPNTDVEKNNDSTGIKIRWPQYTTRIMYKIISGYFLTTADEKCHLLRRMCLHISKSPVRMDVTVVGSRPMHGVPRQHGYRDNCVVFIHEMDI